jgi:hypothetical protein
MCSGAAEIATNPITRIVDIIVAEGQKSSRSMVCALRKIRVKPVWVLLRAQIPHYKPPARPQNPEHLEHARFIGQMMEAELTTHEIEALSPKRQLATFGLDPRDIGPFGPRLSEHAERPIEADQLSITDNRPIRHKLATRPARDIEKRQAARRASLGDKGVGIRCRRRSPITRPSALPAGARETRACLWVSYSMAKVNL